MFLTKNQNFINVCEEYFTVLVCENLRQYFSTNKRWR